MSLINAKIPFAGSVLAILSLSALAADENVIGDPQTAAASGIRLYSENANTIVGFEVDGTFYKGFVTIYPATYPVQYRVRPILKDGRTSIVIRARRGRAESPLIRMSSRIWTTPIG